MRRFVFIILILAFAIYITGCGKKQPELEELQTPMSVEAPTVPVAPTTAPEVKTEAAPGTAATAVKLESLPPAGPYKPTAQEIQTALKNAGFYMGSVDGKIGPLTKKAIEEFQKANGLQVDGKVGPKTWSILSNHLNPTPAPTPVEVPKKASPLKKR